MIDNSLIYKNPVIPSGFYYAKVIHVEEEPSHYLFPKLLIQLTLHAEHGLPKDIILTSILHPTPNSYWHFRNFFHTFAWGDCLADVEEIIGQWGSVKVLKNEYNDTEYSSVKFVYQPRLVRIESNRIMREEKEAEDAA